MLIGCLIRNYKVYENIVFVPVSNEYNSKFSAYVGENGAGKSSVLEALDTFFNMADWTVNSRGKKDEAFVAPIFLIEKSSITVTEQQLLEFISDYFWSVTESANSNIPKSDGLKSFLSFRDNLKTSINPKKYYLILIGVSHPFEFPFFSTFNADLLNEIEFTGYGKKSVQNLCEEICESYRFVYIPVESSIEKVLSLESFELQELMNKDVVREIDTILTRPFSIKREQLGRESGPLEVTTTVLKIINENLENYVNEINKAIRKIDSTYSFNHEKNTKKSLTSADIRDIIIDEYLTIRRLRKSGKPISDLSSGEQRIALIDVAYSILSTLQDNKINIILAIDEPESSLHMKHCYKHFMRICELASEFSHQVLITSHWYGFIPALSHGQLIHIDTTISPTFFIKSLRYISSETCDLPDEIALKSIFDLVSSIIGMMRSEGYSWLICEGPDDRIYLEHFLRESEKKIIILPMGGSGNVVKIYNYLHTPLNEKNESKHIHGKIACLIDTDAQPIYPVEYKSKNKGLTIRRIQIERSGDIKFMELNQNSIRHNTCIEDLLDPLTFFTSISAVVLKHGTPEIISIFESLQHNTSAKKTGFSYSLECIEGSDISSHREIPILHEFLKGNAIKMP
jgi:ABC-type cobalamin/Fe3+-siderophores transport system ATPase subunit